MIADNIRQRNAVARRAWRKAANCPHRKEPSNRYDGNQRCSNSNLRAQLLELEFLENERQRLLSQNGRRIRRPITLRIPVVQSSGKTAETDIDDHCRGYMELRRTKKRSLCNCTGCCNWTWCCPNTPTRVAKRMPRNNLHVEGSL
ncbi:unnamed protein product [Dicrocoelium dendriticum]|nr:unnamed protein product [Dicrocoelium dendriticum]